MTTPKITPNKRKKKAVGKLFLDSGFVFLSLAIKLTTMLIKQADNYSIYQNILLFCL
ncbi:Uncharacterised protein [Chlamydia trachomatis]|nr:Uncharacterised protein [Chlamydia trachomatis]